MCLERVHSCRCQTSAPNFVSECSPVLGVKVYRVQCTVAEQRRHNASLNEKKSKLVIVTFSANPVCLGARLPQYQPDIIRDLFALMPIDY